MKHKEINGYKKFIIEVSDEESRSLTEELIEEMFDSELAMQIKVKGISENIDVIEMPSEEEFYKVAPSTDKLGGFSLENRRQVQGFQDCWNWLKSKIVK